MKNRDIRITVTVEVADTDLLRKRIREVLSQKEWAGINDKPSATPLGEGLEALIGAYVEAGLSEDIAVRGDDFPGPLVHIHGTKVTFPRR